jgi:CBS domain containing-hemolysin-like protein
MSHDILLIFLALFLVVLNGFFVAAEFGIVKLRLTQAEELSKVAGLRGRVLYQVRRHLDAYLSACQLGITLASLGLGWIGEPAFARLMEPPLVWLGVTSPELMHIVAFATAFTLISYLHIVLGELAPKSVAIRKPESVSLWTALPLFAFYWAMYPFIYLLNGSANLLLRKMGVQLATEGDDAHSAEELKQVLLASHHHGELGRESTDILSRALELDELTVGDLMRPDTEMVWLDANAEAGEQLAVMRQYRYSRYPVYEDNPDNLIGIVHIKDLLLREPDPSGRVPDFRELIKPALVIHSGVSAMEILNAFRKGAPHFAIVADEYGTIEGFVTLDHFLEALMGSIQDEFSHIKPRWTRLRKGGYLGSGSLSIYSLERLLGFDAPELEETDVNSVGGLVMQKLERIPHVGDRVQFSGFEIEVREMQGAKIAKLVVRPVTTPAAEKF